MRVLLLSAVFLLIGIALARPDAVTVPAWYMDDSTEYELNLTQVTAEQIHWCRQFRKVIVHSLVRGIQKHTYRQKSIRVQDSPKKLRILDETGNRGYVANIVRMQIGVAYAMLKYSSKQ
jgi:hypothetical protein